MKKTRLLLLLPLMYCFNAEAIVTCFPINGFPLNYTFTDWPGSLVVKNTTAVGTVLHRSTLKVGYGVGTSRPFMSCFGQGRFGYFGRIGNAFPNNITTPGIVPTNVRGIGIRVYIDGLQFPSNLLASTYPSPPAQDPNFYGNETFTVELIKTSGDVANGYLNNGTLFEWGAAYDGTYLTIVTGRSSQSTQIIGKTCALVGNANKEVDFGTLSNRTLANISGLVPGTEKEVSIGINCDAGVKVSVTFSSAYKDPVLQSSIVNQGSAKGVFIYFHNIGMLGQKNQVISSTINGYNEIKQNVGLYRSDLHGSYSPGTISATATYTINFE
ncbi:fimbrial protein [Vagococcus sp. WN89Y]|uniref:fimbrial protein n=1 Tax=Vagococcus sp. WN89Y TaxID=3457258 RepID=UPI003FCD9C60